MLPDIISHNSAIINFTVIIQHNTHAQPHLWGHLHSWAVCLSFLGLVCFTLVFGFHVSICRDAVLLRWVNFQVDLRHTAPNYSQNTPAFLTLETHESFCLVFSWQQTCSWRFANNHLRLIDHIFAVQSLPSLVRPSIQSKTIGFHSLLWGWPIKTLTALHQDQFCLYVK